MSADTPSTRDKSCRYPTDCLLKSELEIQTKAAQCRTVWLFVKVARDTSQGNHPPALTATARGALPPDEFVAKRCIRNPFYFITYPSSTKKGMASFLHRFQEMSRVCNVDRPSISLTHKKLCSRPEQPAAELFPHINYLPFVPGVVPVSPGADGFNLPVAFSGVSERTRVSPLPAVAGFPPSTPDG